MLGADAIAASVDGQAGEA